MSSELILAPLQYFLAFFLYFYCRCQWYHAALSRNMLDARDQRTRRQTLSDRWMMDRDSVAHWHTEGDSVCLLNSALNNFKRDGCSSIGGKFDCLQALPKTSTTSSLLSTFAINCFGPASRSNGSSSIRDSVLHATCLQHEFDHEDHALSTHRTGLVKFIQRIPSAASVVTMCHTMPYLCHD